MTQRYSLLIYVMIYLFVIQQTPTECRRLYQRIVINGHDWTVPNEPGWNARTIYLLAFFFMIEYFCLCI